MRNRLAAICLGLEAFVVFFATLVAASLAPVPTATAWVAGLVLTAACIVGAGLVRRPHGLVVGWVLQGLVLATGFWVPAMFALGGIFVVIWVWFLLLGNRIDRDRARWAQMREDDRSAGVPPSTG
ncbi:MAG TPA: DUF4233 domain-containing protein [Actinomycetales bacterium]|nr:DUF4233 domain-containing protein [Actinomycetales bacterium]